MRAPRAVPTTAPTTSFSARPPRPPSTWRRWGRRGTASTVRPAPTSPGVAMPVTSTAMASRTRSSAATTTPTTAGPTPDRRGWCSARPARRPWTWPAWAAAGAAYIVFGKSSTGTIDLATLGTAGYRLDGNATTIYFGEGAAYSTGAGSDFDADGRSDFVVDAAYADNNGRTNSGSVYVISAPA